MSNVIIIGVGPGIGRSIALHAAREGHDVTLIARDRARLDAIAAEVGALGRATLALAVDVTIGAHFEGAVEQSVDAFGLPSLAVYNAVAPVPGGALDLLADDLARSLEINVVAAARLVELLGAELAAEPGGGSILLTGGILATKPMGPYAGLSVGKAALRALALALHAEWAKQGVLVSTLTVGGMVRAGSRFDPDRIAEALWNLHELGAADAPAEAVFDGRR